MDQLQCINSQGLNVNYVQASNIDASGTSEWNGGKGFKPIGKDEAEFSGSFDGSGFMIMGQHNT